MKEIQSLFQLDNRKIIVAGGGGQIGFPICHALAEAGASVIIADLDVAMVEEKLKTVKNSAVREKMHVLELDVSGQAAVKEFYGAYKKKFGGLYGLINCFHYKGNSRKLDTNSSFFSDFENYPFEAWEKVHSVNLDGTFLMSQAAVLLMRENGGGVILNFSSTYGIASPNPSIYGTSGINSPCSYASSKAAILNFTRYLATHLSDYKIRANTLSPGGVENNQSQEFMENYKRLTPMKRMATPEDYIGPAVFLMSDASGYMTGANLVVDGGWTAW
jgi:NAD(P)-dependent dehydrogenase (short-subunit alcohol dehydrogenase family)